MKPEEAILDVLKRICNKTLEKRLLHSPGKPKFNVNFCAINKSGEYAAAAIYKGGKFAVHDGKTNMIRESAYVHEKEG